MQSQRRNILLSCTSLVSVILSAPVYADESNDLRLEEITVTAQKREQSQQEVPISLNAFSEDFLETVAAENLRDISAYTPGLEIRGVSQPNFKIRGVETSDFGVGTDPAVGIFVDGVYSSRSGAAVVFFSDIERIEVLKGPQGTLLGRNTAAGAVSIHTRKPNLEEQEARVKLRYGRFNKRQFDGMLNLPLTDSLAMRANFLFNERDGYAADAVTGAKYGREHNATGRLQFRWEPSENTAINFTFDFDHTNQDEERPIISLAGGQLRAPVGAETIGDLPGHGDWLSIVGPSLRLPFTKATPLEAVYGVPLGALYQAFAPLGYNPANPLADWQLFRGANSAGGTNPEGPVVSDINGGQEKRDLTSFTLDISHNFDWATLTSISSFKKFDSNNLQDDDGTNDVNFYLTTDNVEENEQFYQELRLSGESGPLTWTVGASYFHEKAKQSSVVELSTEAVDTVLYNLGVTPGVLAQSFNPMDGINACEGRFLDSLGGFISFSGLPLNCLSPAFIGTPLDGVSLEGVSNLALTSFGNRMWTETMMGEGTFTAFSAFADASYAVTDRLNLTAGIRYTRDEKSWRWENSTRVINRTAQLDIPGVGNLADIHQQILTGVFQALSNPASQGDIIFDVGGLEGVPFERSDSWTNVSPRFVVDYKVSENAMIYASYALGYKAGGYNSVQINSFFDNEKIWNIEAGFKSQWLDDQLRFNASIWKYKYDDKQSIRLVNMDSSSIPFYQTQTQDVSGKGIDFEVVWVPTASLRFFSNGGYQDIICTENCGKSAVDDPTGEPSFRLSTGLDYIYSISESNSLAFHLDHSYTSKRRLNDQCVADKDCGLVSWGGVSWLTGEAQHYTNARITWSNADYDFSFSVFANNIFGNRYLGGVGGLGEETLGAATSRMTEPGVWGIELTKHF